MTVERIYLFFFLYSRIYVIYEKVFNYKRHQKRIIVNTKIKRISFETSGNYGPIGIVLNSMNMNFIK